MSKIKGQDLVVLFRVGNAWKAVAFATDCELDTSVSMLETGSKTSGKWAEFKPKKATWRLTSAHLLSDVVQDVDFDSYISSGSQVRVIFTVVDSHPDPSTDPPVYSPKMRTVSSYVYGRSGYAYVQRHTVTARHRTFVTHSVELCGTGPLSSTVVS